MAFPAQERPRALVLNREEDSDQGLALGPVILRFIGHSARVRLRIIVLREELYYDRDPDRGFFGVGQRR